MLLMRAPLSSSSACMMCKYPNQQLPLACHAYNSTCCPAPSAPVSNQAQPSLGCTCCISLSTLAACNGSDLVCALRFVLHNCGEMRRCLELLKIMTESRHAFGDLEKMKLSKLSFLVVVDIVLLALGALSSSDGGFACDDGIGSTWCSWCT